MAVVRAGLIIIVMLLAWWAIRSGEAHRYDPILTSSQAATTR